MHWNDCSARSYFRRNTVFIQAVECWGEWKTNSQTRKEVREQCPGRAGLSGQQRWGGSPSLHPHVERLGPRKAYRALGLVTSGSCSCVAVRVPWHFILSVAPSAKQLCRQRANASISMPLASGSPSISSLRPLAVCPCEMSDWCENLSPRLYTST